MKHLSEEEQMQKDNWKAAQIDLQKFQKKDFDYALLNELTEREVEVIYLFSILKGNNKLQMTANILELSTHTVKAHLNTIFQKLKVANRLDMVIVAHNIGEINIGEA